VCGFAFAQQQSPIPQNENPSPTVTLSLIVTDESRRAVDDITRDQITIVEHKRPQKLIAFSHESTAVDYGIAVDTSGSFKTLLGPVLESVKFLLENQRDDDAVFLETFTSSDKIATVHEFTSDKSEVLKMLPLLRIEGGQSAVVDGIYLAAEHVSKRPAVPNRRHALVVFTDGEDRASYYTDKALIKFLQQNDVQVFVIGIVGQLDRTSIIRPSIRENAETLLKRIAQQTGGRVFFPNTISELKEVLEQIEHDLHNQYKIVYESDDTSSKEFRSVEVAITNSGVHKFTAIVRPGYYINPPASNSSAKKKS